MYHPFIVVIHVLSAMVWIGGMIAIRIAVHPALQGIGDSKTRLGKTLEITGRLFHLAIPFIVILVVTGISMAISVDGHDGALKGFFYAKEVIWSLMALNFVLMYFLRRSAWRWFESGDFVRAKTKVKRIPNLLLPINILLGIAALYLGVVLRGL